MPNISTSNLAYLMILILVIFYFCLEAHAQEHSTFDIPKRKTIKEILITGQKRVKTREVRNKMKLKPGDFFSKEAADRERRRIYNMGCFSYVDYEAKDTDDGVTLIYRVIERPFIAAIEFKGNKQFNSKKLSSLVHPKKNEYFDQNLLKDDVAAIKKLYFSKGYQFTKVDTSIEPLGTERPESLKAKVIYQIDEGPRVRIAKVEIIGNIDFSDAKIKRLIKTKPKSIFRSGIYDEKKLKNDLQRVKDFYKNAGYVDASIVSKSHYDPSRTKMYITFEISEGKKYHIGDLTFSGNELFSKNELAKLIQTRIGDPFRVEVLEQDKNAILNKYDEQGYIKAEVNLSTKVETSGDKSKVSVQFNIRENNRFFIESIEIVGNKNLSDDEIKKMLTFRVGERVNTKKFHKSVQKLLSTGKFAIGNDVSQKKPVIIEYEPGQKANTVNVVVNVVEKGK